MSELKPCPFCGGINMLVLPRTCDQNTPYDPNDRAMPAVRCMTCYGEAVGKDWTGPDTAIEAWNRRPSPSISEGEVEAAREAYRQKSNYPIVPANHDEALRAALLAASKARATTEVEVKALALTELKAAMDELDGEYPLDPALARIGVAVYALVGGE